MTDLEQFKALMLKANADIDILTRPNPDIEIGEELGPNEWRIRSADGSTAEVVELMDWSPPVSTATIVRVESGSRCHFEAAFSADGSIIEAGQFEEM